MTHAYPAVAYQHGWMVREGFDPLAEPVLYRGQPRWVSDDGLVLAYPPTAFEEAS